MSRMVTYTASIINIRIVDEEKRDYPALMRAITDLKIGVTVRSDTGIAMTYFNESEMRGTLCKYTQIDLDGPWFNEQTFDEAKAEDRDEISLPEHLKPNLSRFPYSLNADEHLISFLTVAPNGRRLSPRYVYKFFENIVLRDFIQSKFGEIDITLVQDKASVDRFFTGGALRSLEVIVRRPNDGLSKSMRKKLGNRLKKNNARELREILIAGRGEGLTPTDRTKALATVATTLGEVRAKKEINGVSQEVSSKEFIESESGKFDSEAGDLRALNQLTEGLEKKVENARETAEKMLAKEENNPILDE